MQCNTGKCQEKAWKELLYRDRGRPRQLHKYIIIGKSYINKQSLCRSYLKSVVHAIVIAFFVYKRV